MRGRGNDWESNVDVANGSKGMKGAGARRAEAAAEESQPERQTENSSACHLV